MLLFNEKDVYTFAEVLQAVALPPEEVKRYLISLSCGKSKVLRKGNKGPQIDDAETFTIDWKFKDKKARIKFPMIMGSDERERSRRGGKCGERGS